MKSKYVLSLVLLLVASSGSMLFAGDGEILPEKDNELAKFLLANSEAVKNFSALFGSNVTKIERFVAGKTVEYDITVAVTEGDTGRGNAMLSIQRQDLGSPANPEEGGTKYLYIPKVSAKVQ